MKYNNNTRFWVYISKSSLKDNKFRILRTFYGLHRKQSENAFEMKNLFPTLRKNSEIICLGF